MDSEMDISERSFQTVPMSYSENDVHFNDLIYKLLSCMEEDTKLKDGVKELLVNINNVYCSSRKHHYRIFII